MGFRLSVQPLLPIQRDTLIYGSNDGGMSYKSTDEEAKWIMEIVGNQLYLKPHICKDFEGEEHNLIGPADIEIHRGGDRKIYVIDVARLMPPDPNFDVPSSIFYQQFRPEFMRWYKKALSSDAYSKFGSFNGHMYDSEAMEASKVLREERIPKFAQMIKPPEDKDSCLNIPSCSACSLKICLKKLAVTLHVISSKHCFLTFLFVEYLLTSPKYLIFMEMMRFFWGDYFQ